MMKRLQASDQLPLQCVFIVGPPRSGTTLAYQLITEAFKVGYLTNFSAALWRSPVLATAVQRRVARHQANRSDFRSDYGHVKGWASPHEAGLFWRRWFSTDEKSLELSAQNISEIRRTIHALNRLSGPIVFKNTYNSMRIAELRRAVPEALFVVCQRDEIDVAQSILTARNQTADPSAWWSVKVPGAQDALTNKAGPHEQVALQVRVITEQLGEHVQLDPSRFHEVNYRSVCAEPRRELTDLLAFFNTHDYSVETANVEIPAEFKRSRGQLVTESDLSLLKQALSDASSSDLEQ